MTLSIGPRRGLYVDISQNTDAAKKSVQIDELKQFEKFDLIYRTLCALLFNYAPMSGHPGGSISSGRFVASTVFNSMDYDVSNPDRADSDQISYAAGHKALGLYAMWALRNEIMRIGSAGLLPGNEKHQLRLEDLLGFRRNPIADTPLFKKFNSKPLDGHPTPATPFLKLSTGASGVGIATSLGLAFGALDYYGSDSPKVHIIEGEGGLTPGRAAEAFAAAGTASLTNAIMHLDWNQSSIDSDRVCRDGDDPGDYVQWNPLEFGYLHDWNVIFVPDGKNIVQIMAAQNQALKMGNDQPTLIVYRTIKGWQYGMEGRQSHGAGHKLCSDPFYDALKPLMAENGLELNKCDPEDQRCNSGKDKVILESCFWDSLLSIRNVMENDADLINMLEQKLVQAKTRLGKRNRKPRENAPVVDMVYKTAKEKSDVIPDDLKLVPGTATTLRGELGRVLQSLNKVSNGSILVASADLIGSTSISKAAADFPGGYYHSKNNPDSRALSIGGICEDAMSGILTGLSSYGRHIGAGSSYAAFYAPLGHIASRLHAIGSQARQAIADEPFKTSFLICAHAGVKTGEDGPTHADPQALQLLQENFPLGTMITLTPWDPHEMWPLVSTALSKRPAVIAPFVTRPTETILDRDALGLSPVNSAAKGIYLLRKPKGKSHGTIVLQGSEVAYAFIEGAMPLLDKEGIELNVYYIASVELFDLLPKSEQEKIFPEERSMEAMGISGFTLATMYRWIRSDFGRRMTLHPFQKNHYLGSGQAEMVLKEAGLDGESQFKRIVQYVKKRK